MDFNDIESRIARLFQSIWELQDNKVENHYKEEYGQEWSKNIWKISFNNIPPENKVLSVIANIAKLKDHLKTQFKMRNLDEKLVEKTINNSTHLCWLIDLDNAEKHGYPLTKAPRSKDRPTLQNIRTWITLSKKLTDQVNVRQIRTESWMSYSNNMITVITWEVHSLNGIVLCSLEELVQASLLEWEQLCFKYLK